MKLRDGVRVLRFVACACVLGTGLSLPACGTHGKFTGTHMSGAKLRMAEMKSATEWQMANQAFLAGDLAKALKHVDYSLELNPPVVKSHVLKGRVLMEMSNLEAASLSFKRAQELDPKNVDSWYFQGILAERVDRKEEALKWYSGAADLDPSNPQYTIAAAEMLVALDQVEEAEQLLTSGSNRFEHSPGVRQTLGHISLLKNENERAVNLFQEARLLAPDDEQLIEDLINAQIGCGKYAQAESNLAHLLTNKEYANRRDLLGMRARCLMQINKPVAARDILLKLTAEGSADFESWNQLGEVSYQIKDLARLKEAAARAISISPDRPEGYLLRGLEQRSRLDHEGAARSFAGSLERGRTAEGFILLGLTLRDLGRYDDARSCFEAALKISPDNALATRLLAAAPANTIATP